MWLTSSLGNKLANHFHVTCNNFFAFAFAFPFLTFLTGRGMSTNNNTASNLKRGLPSIVVKELAKEVVFSGGIKDAVSRIICNNNPELFGQPGSELRRQVQNRVQYWKRAKSVNEFEKIARKLGVGREAFTQYRNQEPPESDSESESEVEGKKHSEVMSSPFQSPVPFGSPKRTYSTPTPRSVSNEESKIGESATMYVHALNTNHSHKFLSTEYVDVNLAFPKRTGHGIYVIPIEKENKEDTKLINGYCIEFVGDYGEAKAKLYKATLIDKQNVSCVCCIYFILFY